MRVLVTGGAGYIGSHAVRALSRAGHQPLVLDNLVYGHARIVREALQVPLVVGQVGDAALLQGLLQGTHPELRGTPHEGRPIEAVLHFAAYAYVGESVSDPARYYRNNLGDTLTLLEALVAQARGSQADSGASIAPGSSVQPLGSSDTPQPARARPVPTAQPPIPATAVQPPIPIVFSSTCATYGVPQQVPITEEHPQQPINPYGRSKWMVEQLLHDFARAYGLPSVIFRYFNAAGADPAGDLGEDHNPETHLIPLVLDVMGGQKPYLQIFGDDYPTPDGTCIRDYIHVSDLADAHVLGLERLLRLRERGEAPGEPLIYNLGNGTGYSVQQVIETAKAVTGRGLLAHVAPRRAGDPAQLVAAAEKAHGELGWRPRYPELSTIIEHAWAWHQGALQASRRSAD